MIKIVAIGKRHDSWIREGLETYSKRLGKPFDVEWVLLPYSAREGAQARSDESGSILDKLSSSDYVILLDERGKMLDSPGLSAQFSNLLSRGREVVIVIGGAYGVDERLAARADYTWSLSKLVFPHQLVRLMLIEQIYRAQAIANNHPYHHE